MSELNEEYILQEDSNLRVFGFELKKKNKKQQEQEDDAQPASFVSPRQDDGSAIILSAGTHQLAYNDFYETGLNSDIARIKKYREVAQYPEIEQAIDEIINEMVIVDDEKPAIELSMDHSDEIPMKVKEVIRQEFDDILNLLNFKVEGTDIARKWYIDGRLVYHIILDENNKDIAELRPIDPIAIKKIKEVEETIDEKTGVKVYRTKNEYYVYTNTDNVLGYKNSIRTSTIKISKDSIVYVPSGLLDETGKNVISYLHAILKTANQTRMLEDAIIIYRLARAPERRVFKVDIGNLPAKKAEEYMQNIIAKYRNKITYNSQTGELQDSRNTLAMIEDFWLPSRGSSGGTDITTLASGQNLGELSDLDYFRQKLFRGLKVPLNRLEQDSRFSIGQSGEISREEIKFSKFVAKLRSRFSELFYQVLKIKLIVKKIISPDEWDVIEDSIIVNYLRDNHFTELKETEILNNRLSALGTIEAYSGIYFSKEWIWRNVLKMSDEDIETMKEQMAEEKKEGETPEGPNQQQDNDGGNNYYN